ncbi:peptide methionine sulfoxide reductase MsrA /peptide methionine sulfoxide reductase MsrB [Vibrio variabilis]|uniref:peptide-methionine (S)-S-oxide reductase n=1 Tax=Vibrio variabilis TaxID=990271 RepID=A0ABQ0JJY8_9VIBR|nr:peptide methionine sulfoxide reductase MsrA /peptide methionine sulfoxide reductase MsrB [Vibrio variabilis]
MATLAGGCFWCTESDLEQLKGVVDVVSGYAGGQLEEPTYRQVASGQTAHIEVIQVTFDAAVVSYEEVLDHFFRHIDLLTTKDHSLTGGHSTDLRSFTIMTNKSRLPKRLWLK